MCVPLTLHEVVLVVQTARTACGFLLSFSIGSMNRYKVKPAFEEEKSKSILAIL